MPQPARDNAVVGVPAYLIYRQGGKRDEQPGFCGIPVIASISLPAVSEEFPEMSYVG
jgi:hypothetical protein